MRSKSQPHHPVRSGIVKMFNQAQGSIREMIGGQSKLGAVSLISDLCSNSSRNPVLPKDNGLLNMLCMPVTDS